MPVQIDSVFYELALHDADFAAALRRSVQNLDLLDKGAGKADTSIGHLDNGMKSAGRAASGLESNLKRLFQGLVAGAVIREFIKNTTEAQAVQAQLAAALRSTGGAAGFTLPELEKMSTEMSKLSIFSDEAVKGGLARLLTYTGIQGPMFREAARATLDFATALRIDVNSAAERVGNALQYPTEAINSLTKQGFRFTSEQKRLIAAFESTGQLAKAQAIILAELDLAYKGSAEAARNTLGGALSNLKNQFMETLEVSQNSSGGIIGALNSIADAMPGLRRVFDEFFTQLNLGFIEMGIGVQKADIYLARFQLRAASALSHVPGLKGFAWNQANQATALLGTDQGKGLLDALDKLKAQSVAETLGRLGKSLTDAQHEAQKNARAAFAAATAGQRPESASGENFESQVKKLVAAAQQAHIGATEIQTMVKKLQDAHAQALKGLTDAQIQAQKNARAAFEAATAAASPESADNFESQVSKLVAAAQKAHIGATEIQTRVKELRDAHAKALAEESAKLGTQLQAQLAELTVTTVDDLKAQLAEFDRAIADARKKGLVVDPALVAQLRAAKEQAIEMAPKTEEIARSLERIDAISRDSAHLGDALAGLGDLIEKATAVRDTIREREGVAVGAELTGSVALKGAQEQLNGLIAKEADIRKQIRAIIIANADSATRLAANVANVAGGIANVANVAFGLSSAFAGANAELTRMLGSVAQIADGISQVSELATMAGGFSKLFSTGKGLASALPGIGAAVGGAIGLASALFGKSPEEQARLLALKENNQRLRELSSTVGDLGKINISGTQLGLLTQFFQNPAVSQAARLPAGLADSVNRLMGTALDAVGISAAEFKDIMRSFGLTISDAAKITIADVNALKAAIKASELTQFADTFEGQMSQFNAAVKIFDLSKPIDQFNALRRAIGNVAGGGGKLQQLLDSFDLTTADGIAKAVQALQGLFGQLQTLSPDQAAAFLGGLTPQQFEQLIEQTIGIVRAQAGSGAVPGTGGFNVSRTITETTGNRLEALFSTGNVFAEQTARNTALIAQLLGGTVPVIQAPAPSAAIGGGGPSILVEGGITVNLSGLTDMARATEIGRRVGGAVLDEIDQGLASRSKWNARGRGIVGVRAI